ncbi:hypothetical protein A5662_18470 [Mycobacteriaceae bacterium 1482268.1]|nr:hypothetical protein A5662_18470 [Mycobacteriaceae bacterium 1482268.1]
MDTGLHYEVRGTGQVGQDTAGLVHAMFTGLLFQSLIDPELAITGKRRERALMRLRSVLPRED